MNPSSRALISMFGGLVLLAGCATPDPAARTVHPNFLDPVFDVQSVDRLVVLPVVDLRKDRSVKIARKSLDQMVLSPYPTTFSTPNAWRFEKRGFKEIEFLSRFRSNTEFSADHIAEAKDEWIRTLGRSTDRWILLVTLDDLSSGSTFGATVRAECSAYLFDKAPARVVWRHSSSVEFGAGGLSGLMMKGMLESGFPSDCASRLYVELPYRR